MMNLSLSIITAIAVLTVCGLVYYKIDKGGYDRCEMRHEQTQIENERKASEKTEEIRNESHKRIRKIHETPETDNGPVAPVLERTLDGLRKRHGG